MSQTNVQINVLSYRCPFCDSESILEYVEATKNNEKYETVCHNPNRRKEFNDLISEGYKWFSGVPRYECLDCGNSNFIPKQKWTKIGQKEKDWRIA